VVAAAVVGAATKLHALLLHSHLTHGMDRKTHMWQTLANLLGASAINASTQIMETAALFGRAVDLEEEPAVLEPLFGGLAAVLFSAASLQCLCSATPRAEGFRPLRRDSPPASSTSPRRSPRFTSAPAPGLHAVRAVAGLAGGHGGGAMELAYGGDSGEGGHPGGHSLRNGGLLLRRRLEPPYLLKRLVELGYAAHHLRADYMFQLLGLPERLPWREADQ
jgi:hypothetical protein